MVPFLDLKAQHQPIKQEILEAVGRIVDSCAFALGNEVKAFEEEFAKYTSTSYCAGVNTGTSALHLALLAAGIGAGDEVITVPHTFMATVSAIRYANATPVFVDIDPTTYTMDPTKIQAAITPRTKAIMPVHLYGQPADMDPIMEIAKKNKLFVVEDAAQAHGAEYKGRRCGSIGDIAGFSFYPGKNLGACGEGGAVVTNNAALDQKVKMLRDWGQEKRYHHVMEGFNYRMDNIQGAVLRIKLRRLEAWTDARRAHAARYNERLAGAGVKTPVARPDVRHVYHIYAVLSPKRDELSKRLNDRGISTGFHYPIPVHLQPCFAFLGHRPGAFPISERVASEELSLPMFAELTDAQIDEVAAVLKEVNQGLV
ncbi:MAG TPA: DegT/DnrJ/EryC1/StrS family aminotransferase [Polyangia bacterium]|jgi:dTDP-4-amino-4,6-dideoxygalactose transaminase|nr:DegT/DnrJ/EryC1/StrS family aminotransferase [Polyangia bacterium]